MGTKAENIRGVVVDGAATPESRFFTCDATSRSTLLPTSWAQKFIRIVNTGTVGAWFAIGKNGSVVTGVGTDQVNGSPTAADSGVLAANPERLGQYVGPGLEVQFLLPGLRSVAENVTAGTGGAGTQAPGNFFVRAASASAPLNVHLAEG